MFVVESNVSPLNAPEYVDIEPEPTAVVVSSDIDSAAFSGYMPETGNSAGRVKDEEQDIDRVNANVKEEVGCWQK